MSMDSKGMGPVPVRISRLQSGPGTKTIEDAKQPGEVIKFQPKAIPEPVELTVETQREKTGYIRSLNALISDRNIVHGDENTPPAEEEVDSIIASLSERIRTSGATGSGSALCHKLQLDRVLDLLKE